MQSNVSISTKEDELAIVYGMINFGPERELARSSVKYILTDMGDIRRNYIRLGFHLSEFSRMEYYKDFGFSSLEEFADKNLGMEKSALSRCINVFRRFAVYECGQFRMYLNDRFQDFSYSQLCEMLPLKDSLLAKVTPDMTVKQIRELKKNGDVSRKYEDVSQVATSQPEKTSFCYEELLNKKGIVERNYIKNISDTKSKVLWLFDSEGKRVRTNIWVDLLFFQDDKIVIRLTSPDET